MFPKINALPGAEAEAGISKGNGKINGRESGADMSGHIILAFGGVAKQRIAIRNQAREKTLEILANSWVRVFLDQ